MFYLGWILFFGIHAGMLLPALRSPLVQSLGEQRYKGLYSLISLMGLALLVTGYEQGVPLPVETLELVRSSSPFWMAGAWFFILSANVPGHCRNAVKHPMTIGIALWGVGHALLNTHLNAWLLFLGFAFFVVLSALTASSRGKVHGSKAGSLSADILAAALAGLATWLSYRFHDVIAGVPLI